MLATQLSNMKNILILLFITFSFSVCSQDSISLDIPLVNKLNYMAYQSRYLDTVSFELYKKNVGLEVLYHACNDRVLELERLNANLTKSIDDIVNQNDLLKQQNTSIIKDYNKMYMDVEKKDKKIEEKDIEIAKLKGQNQSSKFLNISLGAATLAAVIIAISNSN